MRRTTRWPWVAALGGLVLALAAGCADEPGTPVPEDDVPAEPTLELGRSALDAESLRVIRTLDAELVSPHRIPAAGLRWPRLEPADGSDWPDGWRVLPGGLPFGAASDGIPRARRLTWPLDILRTTPSAPTTAEMRLILEYAETPGGRVVRATSGAVHVEFPAGTDPHEVGEQDVLEARGEDVFFRMRETTIGAPIGSVEIRPGGSYRAHAGGPDTGAATSREGVLNADQLSRFRAALEESRVWNILGMGDEDFSGNGTYVTVVVAVGDAASVLGVNGSTLGKSNSWQQLARVLTELTGVAIPAK